ncbi:unnamed protein product [Gongylonema pulchrum]|uniref:ANK_REP_REGION domain-containing protein n=1 Tax=Gongylonema pulchrum TaxID=637853 RepID=A0A183EG21_9BILA|nr:unnamed protein product [Gongylonema pulchrum]
MPENELDEEEFNKVISEKYYVDSNKKRDLLNLIPYIDLTTLNGDDTNAVVKLAIADGADEIDVVISRDAALEQDWRRE